MRTSISRVAARWLAGSISSQPFWHGTRRQDALDIEQHGFRIDRRRGRGTALGPAVYMSGDRSWAADYAQDEIDKGMDAVILRLRVKPLRFLDVNPTKWPEDVLSAYETRVGTARHPIHYVVLGEIARALGYGAAGHLPGTVAVFDPRDVRVEAIEEV